MTPKVVVTLLPLNAACCCTTAPRPHPAILARQSCQTFPRPTPSKQPAHPGLGTSDRFVATSYSAGYRLDMLRSTVKTLRAVNKSHLVSGPQITYLFCTGLALRY
ncbi:unnamed protein product [Ectocarpus sp. 13 AM-2016]